MEGKVNWGLCQMGEWWRRISEIKQIEWSGGLVGGLVERS